MTEEELELELQAILGEGEDSCEPEESDIWTSGITKLLIETRLSMESQFIKGEKSRNTLWNNLVVKMKKTNPHLNINGKEARVKFNNLMLTYKRNKKRKNQSGAAPINWQYFDRFDEVYGTRHSIEAPRNITIDTLEENIAESHTEVVTRSEEMSNDGCQQENSRSSTPSKKRRKASENEKLIAYWEQEDEKEQTRHNERMKIEKERNLIDNNKVQVLLQMKDILQKLIDQQ